MFAELKQLATTHLADEPLRRLVLTLLDRHAEPLKRLPATRDRFYPFAGGLLEHTLSVTRSCLQLVERYAPHYTELTSAAQSRSGRGRRRSCTTSAACWSSARRCLASVRRTRCRAGWSAI